MTEPTTPQPRVVNDDRLDEIERTWSSASVDGQREMLEDLRIVIEDDIDNWSREALDKAHQLTQEISATLPDLADDPEPTTPDRTAAAVSDPASDDERTEHA